MKDITTFYRNIEDKEIAFKLTIASIDAIETKTDKPIFELLENGKGLRRQEILTILKECMIDSSECNLDDYIRLNYVSALELCLLLLVTLVNPDTKEDKSDDKKKD